MAEPADSAAAGPSRPSHPPPVDPDADLRLQLREATHKATRRDPYDWQLDIAVALCRGRDVLCLSPTGSGKTLAFVMPCFVEPRTLVWIVSPLNYIEQQQARVFRDDWHLDAVAVNATTSYPGLHKDILNGKYRVIISSPEQLLEYNKLRPIVIQLAGQGYKHVVVVDECHCICVWSENFRKMYGLLGSLRTFLLPGTPFCAATATATQSMRKQILGSLHYPSSYLPINRGYWKPNLSWHVYYMKGSNSSVGEVTQMFPKNLDSESVIPQTIIFVDERGLAFRMMDVLREFLPEGLRSQVEVYHALQSQVAKDLTAKRFEKGEIRILICTEALTMGCDFKNIRQVVMFKVPGSPATALQRGGRSGRDESIQARVVMMVEASKRAQAIAELAPELAAAERMKTKQEDEEVSLQPVDLEGEDAGGEGEGPEDEAAAEEIKAAAAEHGKEDQKILQKFYAPTDECRTLVLDAAFDSPSHPPCISVNGCDNCIRRRIRQLEAKLKGEACGADDAVKQEPVDDPNVLVQTIEGLRALLIEPQAEDRPQKSTKRPKHRRMDERGELERLLKRWRGEVYESELKSLGIHTSYIVTDRTLQAIAKIPPPVASESLATVSPAWPEKARVRWGPSLLAKVQEYDLPNRIVERQVERVRVKGEKAKAKGEEGGSQIVLETQETSEPRTRKRRPGPDDAPKSTPAKKARVQPADSALSAEGSAGPTGQRPAAPSVNAGSKASTSRSIAPSSNIIQPHPTTEIRQSTVRPAVPTTTGPIEQAKRTSRQHYRPHTYNPALNSQDFDFSTAKPVCTISIPVQNTSSQVINQPSSSDPSIPKASTSSATSNSAASPVRNPHEVNWKYYRRQ